MLIILCAKKMKITWVSALILDLQLHRTTQIEMLRHLSMRGHDTLLIGTRSKNKFKYTDATGPEIVQIPLRNLPIISRVMYTIILAFLLPIHILRSSPDFIIMDPEFTILGSIPGLCVSRFKKTKFVLDIRSTPVEIQGLRGAVQVLSFDVSVLFAKKCFSGITIITQMMKDEVCKNFQIKPETVGVWTSGVSADLFDPTIWQNQGNELKQTLGLSNKFVVFYHGYLSESRGIMEAVKAIKIMSKEHSDAVLLLLGSGPAVPSIELSIKNGSLENNLILHDSVDYGEVPKYIDLCDVCLIPLPDHPYWRAQSPLKLLEYLSMEKVVIATDIPAHRNVLGNQSCCIYLPFVNPAEIATAIDYALINKNNLADWGKIGRKIVLDKYTWQKVAEDFEHYLLCAESMN